MNKYHIGTGYHPGAGRREFFETWLNNTYDYAKPAEVFVISDSGSDLPTYSDAGSFQAVRLTGDLGHFMNLVNNQKPHKFNGWSGAIMALALIAYNDEADLIFKEQDCLAFGPWVERLYAETGDAGCLFGNCSFMLAEQSLVLVKHSHIPEFVRQYLDGPRQDCEPEFGEAKFHRMERQHPGQYKRFSFGVGRDRPIDYDAEVWYAQKFTAEELAELKARGLI